MNKKNLIIGVLTVGAISLLGVWYFIFYLPTQPKDLTKGDAIVVTAKDIVKDFQADETKAYAKYPTSKVVEVTGEVLETKKDQTGKPTVTLKSEDAFSSVFITLSGNKQLEVKGGATITVRGIVRGFLSDVLINDGIVIKQ